MLAFPPIQGCESALIDRRAMGEGDRKRILDVLRRRLGRGPVTADEVYTQYSALGDAPRADTGPAADTLIERFAARVTEWGATVISLPHVEETPKAVASFLRDARLETTIRVAPGPLLGDLPWDETPGLEWSSGSGRQEDRASVTVANWAIAETGTLVLTSDAYPLSLAFVETSVILVSSASILPTLEHVLSREQSLPAALSLVTGVSLSADIESLLIRGVHGTHRVVVVLCRQWKRSEESR